MAVKYRYNVVLKDSEKQSDVLARHTNCTVGDSLDGTPGLVAMDVTEQEAQELLDDEDVLEVDWEPDIEPTTYIPRSSRDLTMFTRVANSQTVGSIATQNGIDWGPLWFHWSSTSPYTRPNGAIPEVTHVVTVATGNTYPAGTGTGNVFKINGDYTDDAFAFANIKLIPGVTYHFDQSDASNANHPIQFRNTAFGNVYNSVTTTSGTPGQAGAKTTLALPEHDTSIPVNLFMECQVHGYSMGGFTFTSFPGFFVDLDVKEHMAANLIPTGTPQTINQTVDGRYIDVVAVEAGTPESFLNGSADHPDFKAPDKITDRFVPMDWSYYNGSISSSANKNQSSTPFTGHAIMVLSGAGGASTGWLKNSSLRVIYTGDGISTAYNTVRTWHLTKPVNPATGQRNATMVTGSWGWVSYVQGRYGIPVDDIAQIKYYGTGTNADDGSGPSGAVTTVNRPGTGTWGNDFSSFYAANIIPRSVSIASGVYAWCVTLPFPGGLTTTTYKTLWGNYNSTPGLYSVKSAGNYAGIYAKRTQDKYYNHVITDASASYYSLYASDGLINAAPSVVTVDTQTYYPLRPYGIEGLNEHIEVAASQHSTRNRLLENYTTRGPGVDICGNGSYTPCAYESGSWADTDTGEYWNFGGGTSIAGPLVAGAWGLIIEAFYIQHGKFPTYAQAKAALLEHADTDRLIDVETANKTAFGTANSAPYDSERIYASTGLYETQNGYNGYNHLTELMGTPNKFGFVPDSIRLVESVNYKEVRSKRLGARPTSGQIFPRRKIRLSS